MPVGRGNHGLAGCYRASEGARRTLLGVQIRGHVHVGSPEEVRDFSVGHEAIVERDVGVDAQAARAGREHETVGFAVPFLHVGVRRAHHHEDRARMPFEDLRQRVDDVLDPLVRREQAEREQHLSIGEPEPLLAFRCRFGERDAVGNDVDDVRRYAVEVTERLFAVVAHHDEPLRQRDDLLEAASLLGGGSRENGMERRHDRHAELAEQAWRRGCRPCRRRFRIRAASETTST